MKFLFVIPRFHTNQYFWSKALFDHGHTVRYFVLYQDRLEWHDHVEPDVFSPSPILGDTAFRFSALFKAVRSYAPDFIIVRGFHWYTVQVFIIARLLGIRVLLYNQAPKYSVSQPSQLFLKLLRFVGLAPSIRITPVLGEGNYNDISARYVPFVADFDFSPERKQYRRSGSVHIVAVGKFTAERKNLPLFVRAVKILRDRQYPVTAEIAGSAPTDEVVQELQEIVAECGLQEIVTLSPNLSMSEMKKFYVSGDLFVLPSSNEPAAYSLLEAMNFGLPVVCSDTNGTRCYIEEGENGYIFESDDLGDLVRALEKIVSEPEMIAQMGKRSFELVRTRHSTDQFYASLQDVAGISFEAHSD